MYVREQGASDDSTIKSFEAPQGFLSRLQRRWRCAIIRRSFDSYTETRPDGLEPFTDDRTQFGDQVIDQLQVTDVINLHWIRRFLDLRAFFSTVSVPVVWTLHDMNPFTGGCHYNEGCGKHIERCGACPQLGSRDESDLSREVWQRKKGAYNQISSDQMHIVVLCQWMKREVNRSSLLNRFSTTVIPNGVDTDQFAPRDGQSMRRALGIPEGGKVLLFVAQSTENRRKGFELLREAVRLLRERRSDVFLLSVGALHPKTEIGRASCRERV